jgi:hypothetical protein
MKIWIDDVRTAPEGYLWCKSVNETIDMISFVETLFERFSYFNPNTGENKKVYIELIDIDHDAGDYANDGGDYIRLLDWFEETGRSYPIRIHSMNPVGIENMRRIIERNGWTEVR